MRQIARGLVFAVSLVAIYASAATQQLKAESRDEMWTEATSHTDRITKEYPDLTVIVEIVGGTLTVYYFSKPSNAAYPTWISERIHQNGGTTLTRSCDTCRDNANAFGNWAVPSDKVLVDGFHQLMGDELER